MVDVGIQQEEDNVMKCRCCRAEIPESAFSGVLLGRTVSYFDCRACGYVQTEAPTWLEEAYAISINPSDTGIMARNLSNVSLVLSTLVLMRKRASRVVDYAGGHGFLVRLLRDKGIDALWADLHSENLVARGFEYTGGQAALVTAFEAFEHFVDPCHEMNNLLSIAPNILLTTNLISTPAPQPLEWWYYGLDHGQHIGFYRSQTLKYLANRFDKYLLSDGMTTHFLSSQKHSYHTWRILTNLVKTLPGVFTIGLSPKMWTDHLQISNA